jgi:PLP dependent protein
MSCYRVDFRLVLSQKIMASIAASLQGAISQIQHEMDAATKGRRADMVGAVSLVAVSKTKPAAAVREAFAEGLRAFGENYVQEAVEKIVALADLHERGAQWHLIGPLQSNKAALAATHFDWVQSVDREKIADALARHRPLSRPPLNVLIQVNASGETSKSGVDLSNTAALFSLAQHIESLPTLKLRGVMSIVENTANESVLRSQFAQLHDLFGALQARHASADTLSMGMSNDFAIAIDEGATMVRIGSRIFGARAAPNATSEVGLETDQTKAAA